MYGVGKITLRTRCSRTDLKYTERRDADGNVIGGGEDINLNITVEDITDEQIRADIAAGKYTLEDLVFTASCIQAEASTKEATGGGLPWGVSETGCLSMAVTGLLLPHRTVCIVMGAKLKWRLFQSRLRLLRQRC